MFDIAVAEVSSAELLETAFLGYSNTELICKEFLAAT